jgi:hypothetical protein
LFGIRCRSNSFAKHPGTRDKIKRGLRTMNCNVLRLIMGAPAAAVLCYRFYQEQREATRIEISVGKGGASIEEN